MSTQPVLLGRVTGAAGLNVGVGDTPKPEGQTGQHGHGDIEASPSPTVTRVAHGEREGRHSWTWRFLQTFLAVLVVIFTTWLCLALFAQESWDTPSYDWVQNYTEMKALKPIEVAALKDDPSFIALMVSTGLAGLAAMWLYLIAPTAHTLLAAGFLCLNWVEGLATLSLIAFSKGVQIEYKYVIYRWSNFPTIILALVRAFLQLCEFFGLQLVIQNRLQSVWPALNRPGCKRWLGRCLGMEFASLFIGVPSLGVSWVVMSNTEMEVQFSYTDAVLFGFFGFFGVVTICFLVWIVLVAVTLFHVAMTFHRALKAARQQGLAVAATFQACRGRSILQCTGVIISLATSFISSVALVLCAGEWAQGFRSFHDTIVPQCINLLFNAAGIILLSGASNSITSKGVLRFAPLRCCRCRCRFRRCCGFRSPCRFTFLKIRTENDWKKKTRELAHRGMSLEELIVFYKGLGDTVMPSFQPSVHTTNDVVRLAIIPLTASDSSSYAQLVNRGRKVVPKKMVTHNWSNLFRDLLASVVSDALEEHTFEFIAEMLSDRAGVQVLADMLQEHGSLQKTYWICAFAVNQHAGICGANPAGTVDPVTGLTHPTCKCSEPKYFNEDPPLNADGKSIHCEMNKFDDMMALMARENPDFAEVVAVDNQLDLFGRAWCVAELAEAHRMGMAQSLKMRNEETLLRRQLTLQGLKVENMKASRPEDVVEILAKIPDKEAFNARLQELIFDSNVGLLAAWKNADTLQQMEELSRVLKWLRLSEAVEGGQLVWQRWVP